MGTARRRTTDSREAAGPAWVHALDLRAPAPSGTPAPLVLPDALPRLVDTPRHLTSTARGGGPAGWTARGLLFSRPAEDGGEDRATGRRRSHDWAVTLTSPAGVTVAVLGDTTRSRFPWQQTHAVLPGLGMLLRADRPHLRTQPEGYVRWWRHAAVLHAAVSDPTTWHAGQAIAPSKQRQANITLARWASYGLPSAAVARAWIERGVAAQAQPFTGRLPWADEGFAPEQADPWLPVRHAQAARAWIDAGRTIEQALAWSAACREELILTPGQADRLQAAGWTPGLVADLLQASGSGSVLPAARVLLRYLAPLLGPGHAPAPPSSVHQMSPTRLIGYLRAGVTDPAEIDGFETTTEPPTEEQLTALAGLRTPSATPRGMAACSDLAAA